MWRPLGLAAALSLAQAAAPPLLTLEIRAFKGSEDVTGATRITLHRAGDRGKPVARIAPNDPRGLMRVPPGIYDAQAVHERNGRVVDIRWAERLVVMPYPDAGGHHLEVLNFATGYGALQIRRLSGEAPAEEFALFGSGEPRPAQAGGREYTLFVVPAGTYDIQVTRGSRVTWHHGIDVPLDRTRLWIAP